MTNRSAETPRDEISRRLLALIGLAHRAGRTALGAGAVASMVCRGRKPLVFVAADCGGNQRDKAAKLSPVAGVVYDLVDRVDLARALGRGELTIVAVDGREFVRGLLKILETAPAAGNGAEKSED